MSRRLRAIRKSVQIREVQRMFRYTDYPESEAFLTKEESEAQIRRARNGFLLVIGMIALGAVITSFF